MRHVPWLFLAASVAGAQEPAAPPRFAAAVDQVVVDVVVLDDRGTAVNGLSRDDFVLQEDGAPQEIVSFEAVEVHPRAPASQPATASRTPADANGGPPSPAHRTIVIMFDDLALDPMQGERARAAVADFVRAEAASGDQLALASTSAQYRWSARTDKDIKDLVEVVSRLRGLALHDLSEQRMTDDEAYRIHVEHDARTAAQVADRYWASGVTMRGALGDLVNANAAATYERASVRARQTLAVLERSARSLQGVPGRKAVVLVSPGFFREPGAEESRGVLEACREANVAVYFLDAAAREAVSNLAASPAPLPSGPARRPDERPPDEADWEQPGARQEAFSGAVSAVDHAGSAGSESVAQDTGGFVVRGTNDLAGGLRRVAEDSRAYYLLGYVSTNAARDGRYRKITVRLSPGAKESGRRRVRARRGYYAPTDAPPAAPATLAEDELERMLDSPVERTDVAVRLAAYAFEDSTKTPGTVRCLLAADVDGRALTPPAKGDRAGAGLDVAYETLPRGGGRAERALKRVKLETAARDRVHVEQEFLLAPGVHRVSVAVRDPVSGRSGSASARVDVPATGTFRVSTPIVSASADNKARGGTPVATREFAPGDRVHVAFEVYGASSDPGSGRPRVSTACAVVNALPGAASRARLQPVVPEQEGSLRRAVDFELVGVQEGAYLFVGRAVDEVSARQLTFTEPFTVAARAEERAVGAPLPQLKTDPNLAPLLELAGRYVVEYESALHDLAAEEEYTQHVQSGTSPGVAATAIRPGMGPAGSIGGSPTRDEPGRGPESRRTRADVVFARLAPPFPWATFRDVYEVDGAGVRDRDGRLERAFREKPATAVAQAQAILAESARYNIGPERTVNLPTLPLLFLHPANQARFAFERKGGGSGGVPVEVAFREQKRPTMVRSVAGSSVQAELGRGGDLPAEGRLWIDSRGTVVRSEVRFEFDRGGSATIVTTYRAEPSLAMWVPAEMKEKYEGGGFGVGTDAVARYSRFRKFEVTTEEKARLPEK